jgi:hypothetical protein
VSGLALAVRALECLTAVSLLLQTLEYLRLQPAQRHDGLWRWSRQRADVAHASLPVRRLLDWLFSERVHRLHLLVRAGAAASLFAGSSTTGVVLLFVSSVLILIRWRGAFNGGSDFMTIIVLTGMLIAQLGQYVVGPALAWKAGLGYIGLHSITSYFISGAIKLLSREWRNGLALPYFLDGGLYGPLAADSVLRRRHVAMACSWAFILWECAAPFALLSPQVALAFCATAVVFHFLVFRYFGLNRFFWAWLASHPAVIYCTTLL